MGRPLPARTRGRITYGPFTSRTKSWGERTWGSVPMHPRGIELEGAGLIPYAGSGRWGLHVRAALGLLGVSASRGLFFMKILPNPSHEKTSALGDQE